MSTPTSEPSSLYAGDTWSWTRSLADYPASDGWTLKYVFVNAAKRLNVTSIPDGAAHAVAIAAATSAGCPAGSYTWSAYVEKGDVRRTVDRGTVQVLPAMFGDGTDGLDARSDAQKALDAARKALQTYTETNGAVSEYSINGRTVKYASIQQLRELVAFWAGEVQKEANAQRRRQGQSLAGRVITRFGR